MLRPSSILTSGFPTSARVYPGPRVEYDAINEYDDRQALMLFESDSTVRMKLEVGTVFEPIDLDTRTRFLSMAPTPESHPYESPKLVRFNQLSPSNQSSPTNQLSLTIQLPPVADTYLVQMLVSQQLDD